MPNSFRILPPTQALRYWRSKGVQISGGDFERLVGEMHDFAFTVSGVTELDILVRLRQSLDKALAKGHSYNDWRKAARQAIWSDKLTRARLKLVYRQNMQTSLAAGRWAEIQRSSATRPYLLYDAIMDRRTRDEHAALDGLVRRADDQIWQAIYPPNGFNCRCSVVQMSAEELEEADLTVTDQRTLARRAPLAKVPSDFQRIPGENWRALAAQTAGKVFRNLKQPAAQASAWTNLVAQKATKQAVKLDMLNFVQANAVVRHNQSARGVALRVTGPLTPAAQGVLAAGVLTVTDIDVKDMFRTLRKTKTPRQARVLLAAFLIKKVTEEPKVRRAISGRRFVEWQLDDKRKVRVWRTVTGKIKVTIK